MEINQDSIKELMNCSNAIWHTFKDLCTAIAEVSDKEKALDMVFTVFRDKVKEYKGQKAYGYAMQYAQALMYEFERLIYPGKVVVTDYQDVKRMGYDEFCKYLKDPNPGDLITITQDSNNLARVKIRTVIKG